MLDLDQGVEQILPPAQKELDTGFRTLTLSLVMSYSTAQAGTPAAFNRGLCSTFETSLNNIMGYYDVRDLLYHISLLWFLRR